MGYEEAYKRRLAFGNNGFPGYVQNCAFLSLPDYVFFSIKYLKNVALTLFGMILAERERERERDEAAYIICTHPRVRAKITSNFFYKKESRTFSWESSDVFLWAVFGGLTLRERAFCVFVSDGTGRKCIINFNFLCYSDEI
jgi:hypothetical protein